LDSPAHWKQSFGVGLLIVELDFNPFEEALAILEIVHLELDLNQPQCHKEDQVEPVVWGRVTCRLR